MKTNILVQYQGGGYSGCVWEWNFFYIDENGEFHDIYSSGCDGIDSADKLNKLDEITHYIYHLENPENLKEFATETNSLLIEKIVNWFAENTALPIEQQPYVLCGVCSEPVNYEYIIEYNEVRCLECESLGMCEICCEYVGQDEIILAFGEDNYEHHVCEYCKDAGEYQSAKEREDLRFQAFTTGIRETE